MRYLELILAVLLTFCQGSTATKLYERQWFNESDFVYDLKNSKVESDGNGGTIQPVTVEQMPSLKDEGLSYTLFTLEACGINLPHVHPRVIIFNSIVPGQDRVNG